MDLFLKAIADRLKDLLIELEKHFEADVVSYYGEINPFYEKPFRDFIEQLKKEKPEQNRLVIILNTPGGSAEITEKFVAIIRYHYREVYFIIPDYAMSAGTIWCMSGDKIYMDYSSSLGPIDPQVFNGTKYVPALNYLEKVDELIKKENLTQAEFIMLREIDLAELKSYEQAKNLTISLLEDWLVKYKFKNWSIHRSNPEKLNKSVTEEEKKERAREIAVKLNDTKYWHSHSRAIGIDSIKNILRLEVEDYSENPLLRDLIRRYNDTLTGYILRSGIEVFLHSRNYF
ncbi:MAG: serine dehydrogenasease [Spirochaetes bacterium GWF1_49_6]|nr:MAG: serine dehydrogenasease [Spirochaetes bacterium GWF1_49_6]